MQRAQTQGRAPPIANVARGRKLRKLWGEYEVELPGLADGFALFGESGCLNDIAKELETLRVGQKKEQTEAPKADDGFVSGLGVRHKWSTPQEIGEITVGPYVVDMPIMNEE